MTVRSPFFGGGLLGEGLQGHLLSHLQMGQYPEPSTEQEESNSWADLLVWHFLAYTYICII